MRKICSSLVLAALVSAAPIAAAGWDPVSSHDRAALEKFVSARINRTATPPLAFTYDGKNSSAFIGKWTVTANAQSAADRTVKTVVYTDPATRLRLTVVYTIYKDCPAVEWVARLKNEGHEPDNLLPKRSGTV